MSSRSSRVKSPATLLAKLTEKAQQVKAKKAAMVLAAPQTITPDVDGDAKGLLGSLSGPSLVIIMIILLLAVTIIYQFMRQRRVEQKVSALHLAVDRGLTDDDVTAIVTPVIQAGHQDLARRISLLGHRFEAFTTAATASRDKSSSKGGTPPEAESDVSDDVSAAGDSDHNKYLSEASAHFEDEEGEEEAVDPAVILSYMIGNPDYKQFLSPQALAHLQAQGASVADRRVEEIEDDDQEENGEQHQESE